MNEQFSQVKNAPTYARVDTLFTKNAPSRITRKIRQDNEGNLLIAAYSDVLEYDGEGFTKIPKMEGFASFDAFDALKDSNGNIWIASTHYGIFRYNGKTFKRFSTDNGLPHNRTMGIYEDSAGNIWFATMGGAGYIDGETIKNFTMKDGLTHNDINIITEDRSGKIWFGTRGTVSVYNPMQHSFTEISRNVILGLPFSNVWSIIQDKKNNIWIAGEKGLWRYNGTNFKNFSTEFVNSVYEDKEGNIWTTTPEGTLNRYDFSELYNASVSPVEVYKGNSMFFNVTGDAEGRIWVGTNTGVFRYDGDSISYFKSNNN
jgi:ligand-binding sensor domain-containing protein